MNGGAILAPTPVTTPGSNVDTPIAGDTHTHTLILFLKRPKIGGNKPANKPFWSVYGFARGFRAFAKAAPVC